MFSIVYGVLKTKTSYDLPSVEKRGETIWFPIDTESVPRGDVMRWQLVSSVPGTVSKHTRDGKEDTPARTVPYAHALRTAVGSTLNGRRRTSLEAANVSW